MKINGLNSIVKNSFFQSILVLMTGSVIAAGIRAVATPILTRLYSQEAMGAYSYLVSISSIFMGVVNARYDISIVTDSDEKHVFPLIKLSLLIGLITTFVSSLVFTGIFIHNDKPFYWPILFFFNLLAYSIINVLTAYNNRRKEYKVISSVGVLRRSTQYGLAIILGLFFPYSVCLLIPYVIGEFMGITRQFKPLKPYFRLVFQTSTNEVVNVAKLHCKQALFSLPALIANSLSYSLITIFLGQLYDLSTVGLYSISLTLLGIPLGLIGGNVAKVFMQKASSEFKASGKYVHSFNRVFLFLLVIAIPMLIILELFAEPLCSFIFGVEWTMAGIFIKILAPMFAIRFITSALSPVFTIIKKQQLDLVLQVFFLVSNFASFVISKNMGFEAPGFITLISIFFTVSYLLYFFFIFYYSRKSFES